MKFTSTNKGIHLLSPDWVKLQKIKTSSTRSCLLFLMNVLSVWHCNLSFLIFLSSTNLSFFIFLSGTVIFLSPPIFLHTDRRRENFLICICPDFLGSRAEDTAEIGSQTEEFINALVELIVDVPVL